LRKIVHLLDVPDGPPWERSDVSDEDGFLKDGQLLEDEVIEPLEALLSPDLPPGPCAKEVVDDDLPQ
jgi:hypothetical protein